KLIVSRGRTLEHIPGSPGEKELPIPENAEPAPAASPSGGELDKEGLSADEEAGMIPIRASMVGAFYIAPEPGGPPFVEIGGRVTEDMTVGKIGRASCREREVCIEVCGL